MEYKKDPMRPWELPSRIILPCCSGLQLSATGSLSAPRVATSRKSQQPDKPTTQVNRVPQTKPRPKRRANFRRHDHSIEDSRH